MKDQQISIRGVPETMLQTLYARAAETKTGRHFVDDPMAVDMVSRMDYDFTSASRDKAMRTGVVARTILLDRMTDRWLSDHERATVLNIACGLDTRCYRMAGKYRRWYNLDLPQTMAVRKQFLSPTETILQIACSALKEDWIPLLAHTEGPVLVIVEGLTMYLTENDIKQLFSLLNRAFPHCTVFAEVMNPWVSSHMKERSITGSQAKFTWGVSSGKDLEPLIPPFRVLEDHSLTEGMAVFLPVYKLLGRIPPVRNISNRILVLEK